MLLEYTEETKESLIGERALEIRKRVAGRQLQKALDNGDLDAKTLIDIKQQNKQQLNILKNDNIGILESEIGSRVAVGRSDHHLELINNFRVLDHDISRVSRLSKAKVDTLNELEKRILLMRKKLVIPTEPSVEDDMQKERNMNGRAALERLFALCPRCNQRILSQLVETHFASCRKIEGRPDGTSSSSASPLDTFKDITTFLPQPPRHFNIVSKGCSYIQWSWDPPVMDGGLPIIDYEIRYKVRIFDTDETTGRPKSYTVTREPFTTSLWCSKHPIAHHGYNINGLLAGCEYYDFEVRSQNLKGYSDWTDMLEHLQMSCIKTEDCDPPTAPLFFTVTKLTSTCIHLRWEPPLFDGGREIVGYTISYVVMEREVNAAARDIFVEKPGSFKVKSDKNAIIRNLPSASTVKEITIKARNSLGLLGQLTMAEVGGVNEYMTRPSSRHQQLKAQLRMAIQQTEDEPLKRYVDTMFLTGYQQRIGIDEYIQLIAAELQVTPEDPAEAKEEAEWLEIVRLRKERREREAAQQQAAAEAIRLAELNDDTMRRKEKQRYVFNHLQRRGHFKIRIREIEERIARLGKESYYIDAARSELSMLMKRLQLRQIILNQERDRVRGFRGEMVTSSVLHGAEMKFEIHSFKRELDEACDECANEIAASKFKVIAGQNRKAQIKDELKKAEVRLADRRAKFMYYMKSYEKDMKKQQKMIAIYDKDDIGEDLRQQAKIKRATFDRFVAFSRHWKNVKFVVMERIQGKLKRYYLLAFQKWSRKGLPIGNVQESVSKGSIYLDKVKAKREEMQLLLRETIAGTSHTKQQLELVSLPRDPRNKIYASSVFAQMEEGLDHTKLGKSEGGLHLLYEGDGMSRAAKFDLARHLYEAQLILIRSRTIVSDSSRGRVKLSAVDIKMLAITHGRLGRLFFLEAKMDRCLVEFDRQLSLANEIGDEIERAEAYLGMGSAYLSKGEFDDAVRYLDTSQGKFFATGNLHRQCLALKALEESYHRKYEPEIAAGYAKQIAAIEGELKNKFNYIAQKLTKMTERLVKSSSADIEKLINIERCTVYALNIRHRIQEIRDSIPSIEEELEKQKERVNAQYKLLGDIDNELKAANETEETKMKSNLLLDQANVVVDVEELKSRLEARKVNEIENLKSLKGELQRLSASLVNCDDTTKSLNIDLDVENCDLMKRSQKVKSFRCIAVDKANAAGDSVLGKNSGGEETFIASEGKNIHWLRLKTGELLHIFIGDDDSRVGKKVGHTKNVTCLVFDQKTIFSGSVDETIIAWNLETKAIQVVFEGHEAAITAIATCRGILVSASADVTTRLWDAKSGNQLRMLFGHTKSVLSLELGPDWLITGSADEEARVWSLVRKSEKQLVASTTRRLIGHEQPITCVRYGNLEVLTADNIGRIFIWWMTTGQIIRKIDAHRGPVRTMQFDAVHVVSGGVDYNVCITDLATGEVMQTLRGHVNHVLFTGFDSERILSISSDNTMRMYKWGSDTGPQDKYHVLGVEESLMDVSKATGTPVACIMQWNDIKDTRQLHPGMKLIVQKGDPNELSKAEKLALDRERRLNTKAVAVAKDKTLLSAEDAQLLKPSRVQRFESDQAYSESLANRLFGQAKKDNELFPSATELGGDKFNLAHRLNRTGAESISKADRLNVILSVDNEDEWGAVSDSLMLVMIEMYVEQQVYLDVKAIRNENHSRESIGGRIRGKKAAPQPTAVEIDTIEEVRGEDGAN